MLFSVIGFLIILGPLVVVHEFGHYIFARLFGIKAEIFSIGFGPRLLSRKIGETEWRLSAIPLGGYVKLLGEDRDSELTPEESRRALHKQAAWKRFFVFFGGPLFNFLFAIVVFMAVLAYGEKQIASQVGRVVHGSVAEKAGFKSGDRILKVDGKPVTKYEEILVALNESPNRVMAFEVQHPGATQTQEIRVTPGTQPGFSIYGEQTRVGDIDGLLPYARSTQVGVSNPGSPAGKAGLKTGDEITEFDGKSVSDWETIESLYSAVPVGRDVRVLAQPGSSKGLVRELHFTKPPGAANPGEAWGLHSSEMFVEKTVPESPAEKAGVKPGDRLVSVAGHPVQSFFELKDGVQSQGEKSGKVDLTWEREGKLTEAHVEPTSNVGKDPLLNKTVTYTVGVMPMLANAPPFMVVERIWNPFVLLYKGTERMLVLTGRNFVSIGKMLGGSVSSKTLGGPIMIGKIAGESLAQGLVAVLTTMGLLSIGLGVLNILPVPVLDGGHLVLLLLESVRGRPLTLRQMEVVQSVGLGLILMLMVLVFKNDITRLVS